MVPTRQCVVADVRVAFAMGRLPSGHCEVLLDILVARGHRHAVIRPDCCLQGWLGRNSPREIEELCHGDTLSRIQGKEVRRTDPSSSFDVHSFDLPIAFTGQWLSDMLWSAVMTEVLEAVTFFL